MAFDKSKHYGVHCGGALAGLFQQDGRNYRTDGTEVDNDNKPVKTVKGVAKVVEAKPEVEVNTQLSAQLNA